MESQREEQKSSNSSKLVYAEISAKVDWPSCHSLILESTLSSVICWSHQKLTQSALHRRHITLLSPYTKGNAFCVEIRRKRPEKASKPCKLWLRTGWRIPKVITIHSLRNATCRDKVSQKHSSYKARRDPVPAWAKVTPDKTATAVIFAACLYRKSLQKHKCKTSLWSSGELWAETISWPNNSSS